MTKIKRILMLADPQADHLAYMMYNGLYKVLGKDNFAIYPFIRYYQGETDDWYTLDDGKMGRTVPPDFVTRHEIPERSFDDLINNINYFDIIYLSSARRYAIKSLDQFIARCRRDSLPPIVFSEGEDYQTLDTIRNIKQRYDPVVCFKREYIQSEIDRNTDLNPIYPLPFSAITDKMPPDNFIKDIDVFAAFGRTHPIRENIVRKIMSSHLPEKYKINFGIDLWDPQKTSGLFSYNDYLNIMSRSKINIIARGWGYDTLRRFEAPCFSGLVMSDNLPITTPDPFIDNIHIIYYGNELGDLISRIEYLLNADNERRRVGMGGRDHCMKYHTTEARARYFINKVEQHI